MIYKKYRNLDKFRSRYGVESADQVEKLYSSFGKKFKAVYAIKNKINNWIYVGSTNHLLSRWSHHYTELIDNKHSKKNLQDDWIEYGSENFEWILLDTRQTIDIAEVEQNFIDIFASKKINLYNKRLIDVESNIDVVFSSETLIKMSERQKGKILSEETKKKISESNKGKIHSEDTKQKLKVTHQGSKSVNAKLTEFEVTQIKELIYNNEITLIEISDKFNVTEATIWDIKSGSTWSHVGFNFDISNIKSNSYKGIKNPAAKLTDNDIPIIRKRISDGESFTSIAYDYNVSRTLISYINKGKLWSHIA